MYVRIQKLKCLKYELKVWNKQVFGNVHFRVEQTMANLESIQAKLISQGFSDSLHFEKLDAQRSLNQALSFQESFWKKKARMNWYSDGDRNTTFFRKVTKIRNTTKQMSILKLGDSVLDKQADIENHVLDFY